MEQHIRKNKKIGQLIRKAREDKGFTQSDMAAKMQLLGWKLQRNTYAKIELGNRHISLSELQMISHILQIDYNKLLGYCELA